MSLARTLARRAAVQALYQWQLARGSLADLETQFVEELQLTKSLYQRYRAGAQLSAAERELLDELLEKYGRAREAEAEVTPEYETLEQRAEKCQVPDVQVGYFKSLLYGVVDHLGAIDEVLKPFLDRSIEDVDPVERAILRIAGYELLYCPEIPYRVILNEAINLAKEFGASQSYRYVNGVLDRVTRVHRAGELTSGRR
jgi:N utilization substance protein B